VRLLQTGHSRASRDDARGAGLFVLLPSRALRRKVITDLFGSSSEDAQANVESAIEHIAIAQAIDRLVWFRQQPCAGKFAQGLPTTSQHLYLATTLRCCRFPDERQYVNHAPPSSNVESAEARFAL